MMRVFKLASALLLAASLGTVALAQGDAAAIYKAKCMNCHGADGLASGPIGKSMKVPSFKDPAEIKASDARLFTSTKDGKNKMPAYSGKLTDDQIRDVVKYIRTLQK